MCLYGLVCDPSASSLGALVYSISMVSGQPLTIQGGRHSMMVLGWYMVTFGPFELIPEFDCLFIEDICKV